MKKYLFLVAAILISSQALFAYEKFTKNIHKSYTYTENFNLKIMNRYGNVDIFTSEVSDSISIDIDINMEHYDEDKAEKLLNEINIIAHNGTNFAELETRLTDLFKTGLEFSINYKINIPEQTNISISNLFGDIRLYGNILGNTDFHLEYGKLVSDSIINNSKNKINIKYSAAHIKECSNIELKADYSKVNIENSNKIIALTSFSKVKADTNNYLIAKSKKDTYMISKGQTANFSDSFNSDITINNIAKTLDINMTGGNTYIYPALDFEKININTTETDNFINISGNYSYSFKLEYKETDIKYPDNSKIVNTREDSFKETYIIEGKVNSGSTSPQSAIIANTVKGKIHILE